MPYKRTAIFDCESLNPADFHDGGADFTNRPLGQDIMARIRYHLVAHEIAALNVRQTGDSGWSFLADVERVPVLCSLEKKQSWNFTCEVRHPLLQKMMLRSPLENFETFCLTVNQFLTSLPEIKNLRWSAGNNHLATAGLFSTTAFS